MLKRARPLLLPEIQRPFLVQCQVTAREDDPLEGQYSHQRPKPQEYSWVLRLRSQARLAPDACRKHPPPAIRLDHLHQMASRRSLLLMMHLSCSLRLRLHSRCYQPARPLQWKILQRILHLLEGLYCDLLVVNEGQQPKLLHLQLPGLVGGFQTIPAMFLVFRPNCVFRTPLTLLSRPTLRIRQKILLLTRSCHPLARPRLLQ